MIASFVFLTNAGEHFSYLLAGFFFFFFESEMKRRILSKQRKNVNDVNVNTKMDVV